MFVVSQCWRLPLPVNHGKAFTTTMSFVTSEVSAHLHELIKYFTNFIDQIVVDLNPFLVVLKIIPTTYFYISLIVLHIYVVLMLVTFSRDDCITFDCDRDQKQDKATRYTLTNKIDLCKAKLHESLFSAAILLCVRHSTGLNTKHFYQIPLLGCERFLNYDFSSFSIKREHVFNFRNEKNSDVLQQRMKTGISDE
ncbi:hypothetical protein GQX74_006528 [Glossina fuscipes]|nr:hypothetical protein GQX74_006528 [Glossina fuscipes]